MLGIILIYCRRKLLEKSYLVTPTLKKSMPFVLNGTRQLNFKENLLRVSPMRRDREYLLELHLLQCHLRFLGPP